MTAPARISQVVDVDTYSIQVTLDPALILLELARAVAGREGKLVTIRVLPPEHPLYQESYAALAAALADTFTATLTPDQGEALLADLHDATVLPDQCMACESFSVVNAGGLLLCQACASARDVSVEAAS